MRAGLLLEKKNIFFAISPGQATNTNYRQTAFQKKKCFFDISLGQETNITYRQKCVPGFELLLWPVHMSPEGGPAFSDTASPPARSPPGAAQCTARAHVLTMER